MSLTIQWEGAEVNPASSLPLGPGTQTLGPDLLASRS